MLNSFVNIIIIGRPHDEIDIVFGYDLLKSFRVGTVDGFEMWQVSDDVIPIIIVFGSDSVSLELVVEVVVGIDLDEVDGIAHVLHVVGHHLLHLVCHHVFVILG